LRGYVGKKNGVANDFVALGREGGDKIRVL